MCGIAGIIAAPGTEVARVDLETLATALAHRGPDGEGIWIGAGGGIGLAHRRLAILDTSERGLQPMHSPDGRHTVVYNGEIFNFLELREQLERLGHVFRSESDTEVILAAWREWGEQMLFRFNGMWGLAIHDAASGDVFFARDRFGIKPLHFLHDGRRIAFASEVRALRKLPWAGRELDLPVVQRLLFDPFGIEGGSRTLYRSITRLPAGHSAVCRAGKLVMRRWWRTVDHLVEVPSRPAARIERFHDLFCDAIRLRMRSDVTIGTCLSGGFDSSAIVCEMSHVARDTRAHLREASDWRHAFIASFPGRSNDETPLALEAAAHAGVTPHLLDLSAVDEDSAPVDRVLEDLDDLYIGLPAAPWQIYRRMREHGTLVSLDGHGADELMGGYRQVGQRLSFALRNHLASAALGSAALGHLTESAKLAWLSATGLAFLRGHWTQAPPPLELAPDADPLPPEWGPLNRRLYRLFHSTVLPTILRNFDRLSMAHGVEVRMPFMDWRLVCYVMSLPDAAKVDPIGSKAVARHAMAGRMPENIRASQRKVGFNSPMPEWLSGSLGRWAERLLASRDERFDGVVRTQALRRRVQQLNHCSAWDWSSVGRLWPYIHLKWLLGAHA